MCGIAGMISLSGNQIPVLEAELGVMNTLISHRGPDGSDSWLHPAGVVGLTHRPLEIIDLETGNQPMTTDKGGLDHLQR